MCTHRMWCILFFTVFYVKPMRSDVYYVEKNETIKKELETFFA